MTHCVNTSPAFFEAMYQRDKDPWRFATDAIELSRYDAVVAALGARRYRRAFEPGCSVGVLTAKLAELCDAVYGVDVSPTALGVAAERCQRFSHVHLRCAAFAEIPPSPETDLLLFSEVGYYFELEDWTALAARHVNAARPGATLLASHWLGVSRDHRLSGDQVHEALSTLPQLRHEQGERHPTFRLDRWVRT